MAAALPTGPPQPQPGHMQMDPSVSSSREPNPQLSWEGDKMYVLPPVMILAFIDTDATTLPFFYTLWFHLCPCDNIWFTA